MYQRYLCIGGVEVANPTRTLTYLRNLGHPYLGSPPSLECTDCFSNERLIDICMIPYGIKAGFDRSVGGEIATMVWALFRGAQAVTRVGVRREVRTVPSCPPVRPAVPTAGWVASDYADAFTLPLVLSVDGLPTPCTASDCRFERWYLYDIERFPVPPVSAAQPGEADGVVQVLFYVDPCSAQPGGFGLCSVSFDDGVTWEDVAGQVVPGQVSGSTSLPVKCADPNPVSFAFSTSSAPTTGFCHRFDYAAGGSGNFDVQVWYAPSVYTEKPPMEPFIAGAPTTWLLGGLGTMIGGHVTEEFERALCEDWPGTANPPGWYYQFWRWTDRVTRAVFELVVAVNGANITEATSDWTDRAVYSLDGGATWHTPPGDTLLMVIPPPIVDEVPAVPGGQAIGDAAFTTPVDDAAPWYDPAVSESQEVLGVWIEEFNSAVPWKREVVERQWGGSIPRPTLTSRELHIVGYVYTRSCEATEYAKTWLFEALAQESCDDCDLPDAIIYKGCNPASNSAEFARTIRRVGLIEFNPELEPEFPCCLGFKFEATLRAEVPYLYSDPELLYEGPVMDPAQEPFCHICSECPPQDGLPWSCGCMDVSPRIAAQPVMDDCYCDPATIRRMFVPIPAAPRIWTDSTLRLTISVGDAIVGNEALRNLKVSGFQNPLGLDDPGTYFDCQEPCVEVEVACLPPAGEMVIDGTTRRATMTVGAARINGNGYLSSRGGGKFLWPDVGCNGLMLQIDTDGLFTSPDTTIRVERIGRERQ